MEIYQKFHFLINCMNLGQLVFLWKEIESQNHRLEKTFKTIKSNHQPNTNYQLDCSKPVNMVGI